MVSVIALIVAMSGTSYAVTSLPRNSVGTTQIKQSAVTSAKIKDGAIVSADLAVATRDALKGQTGAAGPQGARGPAGPAVGASVAATLSNDITGNGPLISLGSAASSTSTGPIVVTARSRLQISASVNARKIQGRYADFARVDCFVEWSVAGSGNWVSTTAFSMGSAMFPSQISEYRYYANISLEDNQVVDPGSYDVRLRCIKLGDADVGADYAAINVVAIALS